VEEQTKLDKSIELVKKFCPDFTVSFKKDSNFHKLIGWFLSKIGNPRYNTAYITTIGQNMALPIAYKESCFKGLWQTVLHEGQHAQDAQKVNNYIFGIAYLFPQLIGILGVLYTIAIAIALPLGAPLFLLWGCLSLIFLAPLPAFFRANTEIRGYTVTLAVDFWSGTLGDEEQYLNWLVNVFSGPNYYYMWPFKCWVRSYFASKIKELKSNVFYLTPYLAACKVLSKELAQV
jgi:hypothetical protein